MTTAAVTLGQLLDLNLLEGYEILGGAGGLRRPVRVVVVGTSVHEISALAPGSVVVFGREQLALDDLAVDLAIRLAAGAGLSGLVAARTVRQVPLVTRRLADRFALPLIGVEDLAPVRVVTAFDPYVRAPEIAGLRVLSDAARRFQRPPANANALTSMLADTLGEPVALVDAESRFVAGNPAVHALLAGEATEAETGAETATRSGAGPATKTGAETATRSGAEAATRSGAGTAAKTGTATAANTATATKTGAETATRSGAETAAKTGAKTATKTATKTGAETASEAETGAELSTSHPVATTVHLRGTDLLLQPVQVDPVGPAVSWIVVRLPASATGVLLEPIRRAVAIAALAFAVRVAGDAVRVEREHRRRSLLLNEIIEQPDDPGRRTVERATALGWRLAGWHTAVHVQVSAAAPAVRLSALGAELEDQVGAALAERGEGWVFWSTTDAEADPGPLARRVAEALAAVEAEHPGLRLCAGLGGAHAGAAGIGRSADQARQAALLARTVRRPATVEHFDAVSTRRLLAAWYGSAPLRGAAADLLAPLREADPSGELIRTLRAYLDCQSSAKAAAVLLGVHRNTVMQRMERVTRLVAANLDDPDDRLAVHLATRAADVDWD
ncbi:PucR family transcriptional regulator [Amycolatopsis jejuensis]|uniref:PucR family transcriptional regulator n=1 Tax=Amycolatopsis jejuensis TaxID=330084 RepID=UPI001FE02ED5|nr:helix-turn-helix domain-containing protein [Amycolatopsis jejuensis]